MSQETRVRYSEKLCKKLANRCILLDTSALIEASNSEDFVEFLFKMFDNGVQFATIQDAVDEFTRTALSVEQYEKYKKMLADLDIVVLSERSVNFGAEDLDRFFFVFNQTARDGRKLPSCTDYNLCRRVFLTQGLRLMSGNHRDIPLMIFDREDLITIEHGRELHVEALYAFNPSKYEDVVKRYYK